MKKYLLIVFAFAITNSIAQTTKFQLTVGNTQSEIANSIFQTSDGGYIVAGVTYPTFSNADVYVVKLSSAGTLQWSKTYGGISNDIGHYVIETAGGYLIAGQTQSYSASVDAFLIRTNMNGDTLWTKTYGGTGSDIANKIEELPSGNFLVTGSFQINGINQMGLIRIDNSGTLLSQGYISPYQFASPINKATYLGNGKVGFTGANPPLVIADTNGTYVNTYNNFYGGRSVDAIVTTSQQYVSLNEDNIGGPQGSNITLAKFNSQNTSAISTKKFSTSYDDIPVSIVEASDFGFVILATSLTSISSNQSLLLIKTDSLFNLQWAKRYSVTSTEDNMKGQLIKTADGGYAIAASTTINGNFSNYNYYILKTDSLGDSYCNQSAATFTASTPSSFIGTLPTPLVYVLPNAGTLVAPAIATYGILNTLCTTVSIKDLFEENNLIIVFPNPANTSFEVYIPNDGEFEVEGEITITDAIGKLFYKAQVTKATTKIKLQTSNFPQGIYFVQIKSKQKTFTKKVSIVH